MDGWINENVSITISWSPKFKLLVLSPKTKNPTANLHNWEAEAETCWVFFLENDFKQLSIIVVAWFFCQSINRFSSTYCINILIWVWVITHTRYFSFLRGCLTWSTYPAAYKHIHTDIHAHNLPAYDSDWIRFIFPILCLLSSTSTVCLCVCSCLCVWL